MRYKNKTLSSLHQQQGLSLVEMMVALTLSLIVMLGVGHILASSTKTYRIEHAVMRLNHDGQFAIEFMMRDIRNAGFWGCAKTLSKITNHLNPTGSGYNKTFYGYESTVSGENDGSLIGQVLPNTDTLTIRGAYNVTTGAVVQLPYGPLTTSPIRIAPGNGLVQGDLLLVSDCQQGDLFQLTNNDANASGLLFHDTVGASPGNVVGTLSKVYTGSAFVYRPYTHIYSIQLNSDGKAALIRSTLAGDEELVVGAKNLQVLYGEDSNGDGSANRYVTSNQVNNMQNVISLRINLLMESLEDNLLSAPQSYTFNNHHIMPTDKKVRRVYTSTILLRNRLN
ncbi:MAG: PilW family protein [Gammaproteobacteria bacterium]